MIDTDKYEGHSEDVWEVIYPDWLDRMCIATGEALYHPHCSTQKIEARVANMKLMADAPLLLEEVKRLREGIEEMAEYMVAYRRVFPRIKDMAKELKELIE